MKKIKHKINKNPKSNVLFRNFYIAKNPVSSENHRKIAWQTINNSFQCFS